VFARASAAALGVGLFAFTASAAAEPVVPSCTPVASSGNDSCVTLKVAPSNAPAAFGTSSASLGVRSRTLFTQPGNTAQGGETKTVTLQFDNDFALNPAAVPGNCSYAEVASATIPEAYAACGPGGENAYLSPPGTISGRASTAPPSNYGACAMVFKGPTLNQVILYLRATLAASSHPNCTSPANSSPGDLTVTLPGTIANAGVAGYGKKLTISNIDALQVPLDDFYATIKRGTYFQARCPAGTSPWKLRGIFAYSGSGQAADTTNTTQGCT
jgi:hypothetical protein